MAEEERKEFINNINQHIVNFSLNAMKEKRDFAESTVTMIDDIKAILASVIASAALAVGVDREKFVVHLAEIANEFKRLAINLYNDGKKDGSPG